MYFVYSIGCFARRFVVFVGHVVNFYGCNVSLPNLNFLWPFGSLRPCHPWFPKVVAMYDVTPCKLQSHDFLKCPRFVLVKRLPTA